MVKKREPQPVAYQKEKKLELANNFPEILANPPLENTSFVLSIPIMGEWKNGNALRMLRAMYSQRTKAGQSFEIELIANIGSHLDHLLIEGENIWQYQTDDSGNYLISDPALDTEEHQTKARELLKEMDELKTFLEKILLVQKLARELIKQPKNQIVVSQISQVLESVTDPLQRDVLELAIRKTESIALAVIDATKTVFSETNYKRASFASLRTLGADVASVRFGDKNDRVVLGMYDADTLPEDNNAIRDIQQLFDEHDTLTYVFLGMTNRPAGHNADFVGDAPRESVRRTWSYNSRAAHGSPQISFRLKAYEKLQELAGWTHAGYHGHEDKDTSYRLIYHFGALQEGLLFESSADLNILPPTAMTADRLDGSMDSVIRKWDITENGVRHLTADMGSVFRFRAELLQKIDQLPPEQKQQALDFLQKTRAGFEQKQKVQRRFNRMVLGVFVNMIQKGAIRLDSNELVIDKNEITETTGGDALLHYLEANPDVAISILSSENDIEVIEYFLGRRDQLPVEVQLSPFQQAIREYVGEVLPLERLEDKSLVSVSQHDSEWVVDDHRDSRSTDSLMHTVIAETLALGYTQRVLFETQDFFEFLDYSDSSYPQFSKQWPQNPDEQNIKLHFGRQDERLKKIKQRVNKNQIASISNQKWYRRINIKSFPLFRLFQSF